MKRFILCLLVLSVLTGCASVEESTNDGAIKIEVNEEISTLEDGNPQFKPINGDSNCKLCYDIVTGIVYVTEFASARTDVTCPYLAPNGKPYKFNVETKTLEEIN